MLLETLEPRMLLSGSINERIATDRLQIAADLAKSAADSAAYTVTLAHDWQVMDADGLAADTTLAPLFTTLQSDVATMKQQLFVDSTTQAEAVANDDAAIDAELLQMVADQGNAVALKADKSQLLSDRIQRQNDKIAGLTSRMDTRQSSDVTIFADLQAIGTAAAGDGSASAGLITAVGQFVTDRTDSLSSRVTDIQTVISARQQLVTDFTTKLNQ